MKFLTTLLMCALGAVCAASAAAKEDILPIISRMSEARLGHLQRLTAGCKANVCFAIDGSDSISSADFEAQKLFVLDVALNIDISELPVELAAVQYANGTSVISRLTSDLDSFRAAIDGATQMGGGSPLLRGLNFCMRQFRRRSAEANKIVVFGDGRSEMGARVIRRANRFRRRGGEVYAIGTRFANFSELLAIAGGDISKAFQVNSFGIFDLLDTIESVALDICGMPEASVTSVARDLNKK